MDMETLTVLMQNTCFVVHFLISFAEKERIFLFSPISIKANSLRRGVQPALLVGQFQASLKFRRPVEVRNPLCFCEHISYQTAGGGSIQ